MGSVASSVTITANNVPVQCKGGLYYFMTLKLASFHLGDIERQLVSQISRAPNFFHNANVVLDLQQLNKLPQGEAGAPQELNLAGLLECLRALNFFPVGLLHGNAAQIACAKQLGLAPLVTNSSRAEALQEAGKQLQKKTSDPSKQLELKQRVLQQQLQGNRLLSEPVRSGQQIYVENGDLIACKTVSNGAELLADGNIHVYGVLRGRAIAGMNGNQQARIFCNSLEAELVSIAGVFQLSEDFNTFWKQAVEISLQPVGQEMRLHFRLL
jgi:septum site-determining protein MinC